MTGDLFTKVVEGVDSFRIRNLASTGLRHSVNWSNITEFVSAVAFAAGSVTARGRSDRILPSGYYLVRRTRGIPVLTVDARGVVLGEAGKTTSPSSGPT